MVTAPAGCPSPPRQRRLARADVRKKQNSSKPIKRASQEAFVRHHLQQVAVQHLAVQHLAGQHLATQHCRALDGLMNSRSWNVAGFNSLITGLIRGGPK